MAVPARAGFACALLAAFMLGTSPALAERLFATPYVPLSTRDRVSKVGIADITGDGALDIVWFGGHEDNDGEEHFSIGTFLGPPIDGAQAPGSVAAVEAWAPAIALGDLNGDGRPDLATIERPWNSQALLRVDLTGPGGFASHAAHVVPGSPASVAIGDLAVDGHRDVAVATADSVLVFAGNGTGGLTRGQGIAVSSSTGLAIGDIDGDGRSDFVVTAGGSVQAFLAEGAGGFRRQLSPYLATGTGPIGLADVDADGRLDLIVPGGVLLGDGVGGFGARLSHGVSGPFAAADFDRDGRLDLAVVSPDLTILLGRGDGTFAHGRVYQVFGLDIAVGDLDRDGNPDLAVAHPGIAVFYGNGDGTFGGDVPAYPVGDDPVAFAAGDVNGDRRTDMVVANAAPRSVSILFGGAGGEFLPRRDFSTGAAPTDVLLDDFDRDGDLDLAVAHEEPRMASVFGGHGDGTFGPPAVISIPTGARSLASGDLDEDGYRDLAVPDYEMGVWVFFGGSSGLSSTGRTTRVGFEHEVWEGNGARAKLALADVTGDGHLDIVRMEQDVSYVQGHGDGTFGGLVSHEAPEYGWFDSIAIIDLCDNCRPQVVAATYCCWLTNSPDHYRLGLPFGGCAGTSGVLPAGDRHTLDLAVGDLSGDGIDDLVTPWRGMTVELGNGLGGFGSRQEFPVQAYRIQIADVNNDAKPDVLLLLGGHVAVLLNQSIRPTVPEAPDHVTARPGDASIVLSWDPVEHPDLVGYRIHYGFGTVPAGTDVSTIDVPMDQTSATVPCLPESIVRARVTAVDRWGRESQCAPLVAARPGPAGGEFSFVGGSLHSGSRSPWIVGLIELDAALSAADIVPGTVTMNGVGPAQALAITDRDHDGRRELMVRFPRAAVEAAETTMRAHVEGRVPGCPDTLRFTVDDSVRIGRPGARPQGDEPEDPAIADRPVTAFALHAAVPSPAQEGCTIAFDLPEPALVRLKVFDLRGRLVSTVLERQMPGGAHRLWWARQALPDGVYFASIEAAAFKAVRRIVLLR